MKEKIEMSEVLKTHSSDAVSKGFSAARRSAVVFAALASLAILASPIHGVLGATAVPFRNIDDPGRIAYESHQSIGAGQQLVTFPVVPAGHRLVIQHVSAFVNFNSAVSFVTADVSSPEGIASFLPSFFSNRTKFDQPVQLYVDAGNPPQVFIEADSPVEAGTLTLTGYLLDCTAAPCATIAH